MIRQPVEGLPNRRRSLMRHRETYTWRLTPAARKAVLLLPIVLGIGWIGVDIALFVLLITARTTNEAALVISGFNAIGIIVLVAVPPLSLGILVTGLILGLGTRWGLYATGGFW